jgi:hypothetical protein
MAFGLFDLKLQCNFALKQKIILFTMNLIAVKNSPLNKIAQTNEF